MDEATALEMLGLHVPVFGDPLSKVVAGLVVVPDGPVLAQVVARVALTRDRGRLVRHEPVRRGAATRVTMLCVAFGPLIETPDSRIGFGSLEVGPLLTPRPAEPNAVALPDEELPWQRWLPDPSIPVTAGLLRLISPEKMVAEAVPQLRAAEHWHRVAESRGRAEPMTEAHLRAYRRLRRGRTPGARPSDREIALITRRYLQLVERGVRHPLRQMADELGLTRTQVRDRIHRARVLGYLMPARQGRVSAERGPAWPPPTRS
jgi:hypothetical protein